MDGVFVMDGVFAMDGVDGGVDMDAMDTVDSSESEFDDPVLLETSVSLLDGTNADAHATAAPPRQQQQQHEQHAPDNDNSDLSSEFDSNYSSELGDPVFDQDPVARFESTLHRYGTLEPFSRPFGQEQQPADPAGSYVIPEALCFPPPTDVDVVRVNPVVGFQSADMRFGPGTRETMKKWLLRTFGYNGAIDDEIDVAPRPDTDAEAYDCYEEDGHVVDTLEFSQPAGPLPVSGGSTSDKAQPSSSPLSSSPTKSQEPSATESTETYGTESWETPPMHAASSAKGPQARKPPPVARTRLNLTALSQKYNLFFAAFQEDIHVFRPQQAPEILHGALLILRPQPTEAAKKIGGYQNTAAPHQVNHMIIGDLGDAEILLMAFDDGDVIAYYTRRIVEYLSSKWRGHPTRSPKKPTPFFRETVGASAWGLAIHTKARLMAVSSNLAEVTVFAPALCGKHVREAMERGESAYIEPDCFGGGLAVDTSRYDPEMLQEALQKRARNWRILLPLGRNGANIPSIAFTGDWNPPDTIIATDVNGCIWLLNIWEAKCKPLRDKLGHARASHEMGWGILSLPRSLMLRTNALPPRIPAVLSRKQGLLTHSLNYSLVTDPSIDAFIQTPAKHYDQNTLDSVVLPGVPYTKRMLYELDVLAKRKDGEYGYTDDEDSDDHDYHESEEDSDNLIDAGTNYACYENPDYDDFKSSSDEEMPPAPSYPRIRDKPFTAVDLTYGFFQSMIACPSTSQTWPAPDPSGLLGILQSPSRHESTLDQDMEILTNHARPIPWSSITGFETIGGSDWVEEYFDDEEAVMGWAEGPFLGEEDEDGEDKDEEEGGEDAAAALYRANYRQVLGFWPDIEDLGNHYVFLQTLSNGAQMFSIDIETDIYQVDDITKFMTDDEMSADMIDMLPPFHRCSMIHFIPEIRLIVVGKMQGQVVLLRPFKNNLISGPEIPIRDEHRSNLAADNFPKWAFRTEWTLPLQKDRMGEKYTNCCLLGIAVSRVPEPGADKYALKAETQPAAGKRPRDKRKAPRRRWRLIMYYMDHTVLQYYIEESDAGNAIGDVLPVLQEAQQASWMRQQANPYRPRYEDGVRVV